MDIQLADVLTLAGAVVAAGIVTSLVEVLKIGLHPILPGLVPGREQAFALIFSLLLVIAAFLDQAIFQPSEAFAASLAWLAIAKLATGIHDEATNAPGSIRANA